MSEKIGHYTIVSKLGRGGMGVVYKAHEESLNRYVAIKVLGEHLIEDEQFLLRFKREAQSAAGLSHPNIVQIYFIGEDEGRHYFVMEYVSGKPIDSIIRERGSLDSIHAAQIILQAAQGLAAAHDKSIIHRDIKPANLILDERGIVKIADFGLALPSQIQSRLTATGMLMGTPGYMAPEQCRGEQADHRTDIYALGVTLYEMLTGNVPFKAESPLVLLKQILDEPAPDVSALKPDVKVEIIAILDKMIAKERENRFQSAHELVDALEGFLSDQGVRTMSRGLATLAAGAGVAAAAVPTVSLDAATAAMDAPTVPRASLTPSEDPTAILSTSSQAATTAPDIASTAPLTPPAGAAHVPPPPGAAVPPPPVPSGTPVQARKKSWAPLVVGVLLILMLVVAGGAFAAWKTLGHFWSDQSAEPAVELAEGASGAGDHVTLDGSSVELGAPVRTESSIVEETSGGEEREVLEPAAADIRTASVNPPSVLTPRPSREGSQEQTPVKPRANEPVAPAGPRLQGTAIVVTGDSALTDHIAGGLLSRFRSMGIEAVDARFLPETESMVLGDPSVGALSDALRSAGSRWMVLARIEPAGERQLRYMGRSETSYRARINVSTIDVATGRPVGQTYSESIEYTSLNAERQAETALRKIGRDVAESIRDRRP